MSYIKEEFPGMIDNHWDWDLLENMLYWNMMKNQQRNQ